MARGNDQMKTTSNYLIFDKYLYFPPTRDMSKNTRNCKANEMYQNVCQVLTKMRKNIAKQQRKLKQAAIL